MHYFSNKFSKIAKRWGRSLLIFNIGNLALCDLAKLCFFKLIMTISNLKNQL